MSLKKKLFGGLRERLFGGLSKNVIVLGLVSMLTDISSEMIFPLLPLFLVDIMGASAAVVGLIEGVAEGTADAMKLVFGWYSDKIGKRRPFVFGGYGLSTITKPLFALATSWQQVFGIRMADRIGKGMRVSARDVMVVTSTPAELRGKAFGFRKMMDSLGAVIGPLIAIALLPLFISATDPSAAYRDIFWLSVIPAFLAVVLIFFVKEKEVQNNGNGNNNHYSYRGSISHLGPNYKRLLIASLLLALSNFSVAFFILRAYDMGYGIEKAPMLYVVFNLTYALLAMPSGEISDKIGRKPVLLFGHVLFGAVCLGFAFVTPGPAVWILFALYGFFLAIRETLQRAFISDIIEEEGLLGTAFGTLQGAIGLAAIPASIIAGLLWDVYGSQATFFFGAGVAFLSAILLALWVKEKRKGP
ncbi:Multidrug resistance protein MdtG [Candidatus Burarchaeum australiense]|nr:Multidrug resistance protein MdtG [Candidatus Burarchaeum australiense]